MPDFLPRREADFLTWSQTLRDCLLAAPGDYEVPLEWAAAYAQAHNAYAEAFARASSNDTGSTSSVIHKNDCLKAVRSEARRICGHVRARPGVSDALKVGLGLKLNRRPGPRIARPARAPLVQILSIRGRIVRFQLVDPASPSRRGKPRGVAAARLLYSPDEAPPASSGDWKVATDVSRPRFDYTFPVDLAPGARVWLTACWSNPRMETGPLAAPVPLHIAHAGPIMSHARAV